MTTYLYTSSGPYSCQACNMGFSNTALLAKHKARFCIGDAGDMVLIRQCRRCREHKCSCEDVPEIPEVESSDNDTNEYERMREAEKRQCQDVGRPRRRQSNRSDESMSIHLIRDRSKYNPNNDPKLQSLAANHGKQMEFLSNRNKDLERQRDEIRRRLGDLGKKPADTDNTSALLAELRDQEARNQRLLDELKKQLLASRQPVAIIGEQQVQQQKKTYTYPVYYGNSLVAEISAIRQAYIQSGGNDPEILAQLAQMLAEAQAIEEAMRNKKPPEPRKKEKKTTEITSHVMTMDMENERLNRELLLLQEQNLMARNRRKDDREDELERELRRLQQEHLMKMYELQQNMEALRQDTIVDRTRLQLELNTQQQAAAAPQSIVIHQPQCPPNIQHTHVEKGCYDHHQCRCNQRCPPPPKPPPPPPPEPYIPLQLPPPPPIRVEEPPPRGRGGGGRGGGGYSWYVEEYIPPQVIEEGAEVTIPKEGYKIERRFPSGGGPPIEIVSRGQGGPPPGPGGPPGPGFRLPSQIRPRPRPGDRMIARSNEFWNRPIPGVDEGVQFDH